jgi:hypothetical protein
MFASKTPRDLNHDPEPWVSHHGRHEDADPAGWDFDVEFTLHPRPEFDHVQHNPPNSILVQIREDNERSQFAVNGVPLSARLDMWLMSIANLDTFGGFKSWDSPGHPRHVLTTASEQEIDHARRVLTRLAHLSGGES